jgi:hypothetical protein
MIPVALLMATPVQAQVGHPPERSPYTDLRATQATSLVGGYIWGSGGKVGVDPSDGPPIGIRYDRQVGAPLDVYIGISGARLQRLILDPNASLAARTTGPVNHEVIMTEVGMSLVLTGRKTWHGLVPYLGGGFGIAFGSAARTPTDILAGFNYGTKLVLSPHIGVKWYPVQALAFKVEGRTIHWRLRYPDSYFFSPLGAPAIPPILDGTVTKDTEWTHHPALFASLGYTFTF